MARSGYVAEVRALIGTRRLLLPSVGTAVFDDDRLLLVRHTDGSHTWGLPGGAIEPGEHPADAAVREVHEETGLAVEVTALAGVFGGPDAEVHYDNGDRTVYVTTVFVARPGPDRTVRLDRAEVDAAEWFDLDRLHLDRRDRLELGDETRQKVAAAVAVHRDGAPPAFRQATWRPA